MSSLAIDVGAWLGERRWSSTVDRSVAPTDRERGYIRSYIWLRIVVGVIGLLLPLILFIGEGTILDASVRARDSLSSYYHSPMRDWFVASLTVISVLLITYMLGTWNREFWISTVAGVALLLVAFFPTERPHLAPAQPRCESSPKPVDCTDLEHRLGEVTTGNIHLICAAIALGSLAVIAFLWSGRANWSTDRPSNPRLAGFHFACGLAIVAALLIAVSGWIFTRWRVSGLTPLYVGEVATVFAFALSWIAQGRDLAIWLQSQPHPAEPSGKE